MDCNQSQNKKAERHSLFITGTDTGIGKTIVSAILVKALSGTYWKPIQSGIEEDTEFSTDSIAVKELTKLSKEHFLPERHLLKAPLSPHLSSRMENLEIELADFELPVTRRYPLIIEGAGGVLVPINKKDLILDLIEKLACPVLIVAKSGLGTINHSLMTIATLKTRKIPIIGLVLNGPRNLENEKAIEHFGKLPVLGHLDKIDLTDPASLDSAYLQGFERFMTTIERSTTCAKS